MKELKDFIHLYLGCECLVMGEEGTFKLTGISYDDMQRTWWTYFENTEVAYAIIDDTKPILRKLSDMSDEEASLKYSFFPDTNEWRFPPESFAFLLSKHFDLFGLIESGLAIDSKTLKEKI